VANIIPEQRLKEIEHNTLIVFSGDNGSSFGPESPIGKAFNQYSNGLRGFKRGMYEGALRQAVFARWPGTVPAGRVNDEPWAFWDLLPTFAELAGVKDKSSYKTDGLSLVEFLKGGNAPERDYFYWELHESNDVVRAARWGDWKAVMPKIAAPIEIYDLANDHGEKNDLAKQRPELVAKAKSIFAEAHTPHPVWTIDAPRPKEYVKINQEACKLTSERVKARWVPPNAEPIVDRMKK